MAKVALTGGKLIKVGEKIGLYPGCCCGGECCEYSLLEEYTVTYNGPEGNKTATGFGPFMMSEDGSMMVLFNCTGFSNCAFEYLGLKLVVTVTINAMNQYDGYIEAAQPSAENSQGGVPCDQQKTMDGLSFDLISCITLDNATLDVALA